MQNEKDHWVISGAPWERAYWRPAPQAQGHQRPSSTFSPMSLKEKIKFFGISKCMSLAVSSYIQSMSPYSTPCTLLSHENTMLSKHTHITKLKFQCENQIATKLYLYLKTMMMSMGNEMVFYKHILGLQGWFCWISDFKLSSDKFVGVWACGESIIGRRKNMRSGPNKPGMHMGISNNSSVAEMKRSRQAIYLEREARTRLSKLFRTF